MHDLVLVTEVQERASELERADMGENLHSSRSVLDHTFSHLSKASTVNQLKENMSERNEKEEKERKERVHL